MKTENLNFAKMTKNQVADLYEEITGSQYCYGMEIKDMIEEIKSYIKEPQQINRNIYTALIDLFKENQIELNSFDWALNDIENAQELFNYLHDNSFLDVDIIYYSNAINYLKENDPSLCDSLELASEYGFELKNINSELLASLLATNNLRADLYNLEDEINEIFNEFLNA